jgi:hypothetical protein
MAPDETNFDFFSTTAQVIPLLFVVLAVEFRGGGFAFVPKELLGKPAPEEAPPSALEAGAAAYSMFLIVVLAIGEGSALHVLSADATWGGWKWMVGSSLVVGSVGVIAPLLILQYNVIAKSEYFTLLRPVQNVLGFAAWAVVGATVTGLLFLVQEHFF